MHTTISDGTDTPELLLQNVKKAGIELFSITDHDAIKGAKVMQNLLEETASETQGLVENGHGSPEQGSLLHAAGPGTDEQSAKAPHFLPGVEFSCKDSLGKYHILGYCYDPDSEPINRVVELGHEYRMNKVQARLDFIKKQYGFGFSEEDLFKLFSLDNPGKPHIGNMMVKYGYAKTKEEAIKEYINRLRIKDAYVKPEEAIRGILGSGGIPVLAHPSYGNGDQLIIGDEMDARLRRLIGFGLQGVEAFYSGFSAKLNAEVLAFAEKYNLYVTAGSDYHGTNKLIAIGDTGLKAGTEYPEGMKRFLERISQ